MGGQLAYLETPEGHIIKIGPTEIGYLETLVRDGPFPSVTAWVRAHLGRDHGYRREDVWRYVDAGMATVAKRRRPTRGRPATYGPVEAPMHTRAVVAWYRGEDDPALADCIEQGWKIRPGSAAEALDLAAIP